MAEVVFEALSKRYGRAPALDGLTLRVPDRSFSVVSGPPGCGKSVLLRLLVGIEMPDAGRIQLDGTDITDTRPGKRPIGYVPQSFALFPHMTVRANIAYPLKLAGAPRDRIDARVGRSAEMVSISHLLDRTPDQLSGGEKQRVAVARGLSKEARVFVLDDPLVGLDYKLRERLMGDLKLLRGELDATFVYATSDPLEALVMSTELSVLEAGRLIQTGPVEEVYAAPASAAALRLVGFPRANLIDGHAAGGRVTAGPLALAAGVRDGPVQVGVRPEALQLADGASGLSATVTLVEDLGGEYIVYLDAEIARPEAGERVGLALDPADALVFDAATGAALCHGAAQPAMEAADG
jgi:multiple sugar transport system ATP-binding protein